MMTNSEVQQAADSIEEVIEKMIELDEIVGYGGKLYVPSPELCIHVHDEEQIQSHVLNQYNSSTGGVNLESSINYGLNTWFQYDEWFKPKHHTNTILKTRTNHRSVLLCTNTSSDYANYGFSMMNHICEFELQKLGTPDADEYFFLKCMEYDDLVINALLFMSEWKSRSGANIVLRLGTNPVQICAALSRIAREAYDEYDRFTGNA